MLTNLFKKIIFGIVMGSTILNFILLFAKLFGADHSVSLIAQDYIRQSLCAMFVSTAYSLLSIAYDFKKLPYSMRVLIHMGGGLIIYFITAYYAHWLPIGYGTGILISTMLFMAIVSFLIWLSFYLYYRLEAKKINERINSMK